MGPNAFKYAEVLSAARARNPLCRMAIELPFGAATRGCCRRRRPWLNRDAAGDVCAGADRVAGRGTRNCGSERQCSNNGLHQSVQYEQNALSCVLGCKHHQLRLGRGLVTASARRRRAPLSPRC